MMMTSKQLQLHLIEQSLKVTSTDELRIDLPRQVDVLCGRGKMCFHHEGNDEFRKLIAEHADTYQMAPSKKAKMQVVMLIVDTVIARGGRFLINNKDGTWADGERKQGKKKTGHAFRDALRGRVKCITQMRALNSQCTMLSADDSSHSMSYGSCDEFDLDGSGIFDPTPIGPNVTVENSNAWKSSKIDRAMADDLLNFFIAEQLEDAAAQKAQSYHS